MEKASAQRSAPGYLRDLSKLVKQRAHVYTGFSRMSSNMPFSSSMRKTTNADDSGDRRSTSTPDPRPSTGTSGSSFDGDSGTDEAEMVKYSLTRDLTIDERLEEIVGPMPLLSFKADEKDMVPVKCGVKRRTSPLRDIQFDFTPPANPTRNSFERCIASIEGAKYCIAYSSGVSALSAIIHCCKHGDHIICCDDAYSGTQRLLRTIAAPIYNISSSYVDFNEDGKLAAEISKFPNTTLIMFETPSNPTLKLIDFHTVVKAVQRKRIFTMCDSTFMSPAGQSPLTFGIDMVVHSTTKYVNGHSDVLGGVVCTNNDYLKKKLRHYQNACGCVLSPFDSYLVLRGVKTLSLRMDRHESNALKLASWLEQHPQVESVRYPGLPSHPQYDLACKQMFSFGGMIAFKIKGGLEAARTFLNRVKVFTLAESLGAVESLIESPALMTHHNVPEERLREAGVEPNLIRVSVGIEAVEDLIEDLDAAFKGIETGEFE